MPLLKQDFDVRVRNTATGESREVWVTATDPAAALQTILRRRSFAEWFLSEQPYTFLVKDRVHVRERWRVTLIDGNSTTVVATDTHEAVLVAGNYFGQDVAHLVRDVELDAD